MAILNIVANQVGQTGVRPQIGTIETNDTVDTVITAGYLNTAMRSMGFPLQNGQLVAVQTKTSPTATDVDTGFYEVSYDGTNWSLVATTQPGDVVLPTIANHIAIWTDTSGTLSKDAATAINGGNIQAGLSGTAGTLASYPSTAARGSLKIAAVANAGDTNVTISNASHGQATVYSIQDCGATTANLISSKSAGTQQITSGNFVVTSGYIASGVSTGGFTGALYAFPTAATSGNISLQATTNSGGNFNTVITNAASVGQNQTISIPDVGAATGQFLVKSAALVSGNVVVASGTAGKVADGGFAVKANTTAAYAGGGTSNAFVATGIGATSIVTASILSSTNAVSIVKVVPTANTLTVDFSADPGANTTVSWIAITPAV